MIDVDLSNFEKTLDLIQTMGNKSPRMLQATVRQAGKRAMTPWRQATAKQAGVKARKIQRSTKTKSYASAGEFIYEIRVRAEWSYLTEFSPAQTDEGIEASPWGSRQIFAGSFFSMVEAFECVGVPLDKEFSQKLDGERISVNFKDDVALTVPFIRFRKADLPSAFLSRN